VGVCSHIEEWRGVGNADLGSRKGAVPARYLANDHPTQVFDVVAELSTAYDAGKAGATISAAQCARLLAAITSPAAAAAAAAPAQAQA